MRAAVVGAGFAGMSVFLFLTIRRRVGAGLGLAAVAFVWSTWAYEYSYEARPYALLMCAVAAAFYFWSEAATGERRAVNISLFGASLLVMMSTHYYAGLLLIPFGVGELVRLARALTKVFPKLQFITTTHSPTLLAGLVVGVANGTVLFLHEQSFADPQAAYAEIREKAPFVEIIEAPAAKVSLVSCAVL